MDRAGSSAARSAQRVLDQYVVQGGLGLEQHKSEVKNPHNSELRNYTWEFLSHLGYAFYAQLYSCPDRGLDDVPFLLLSCELGECRCDNFKALVDAVGDINMSSYHGEQLCLSSDGRLRLYWRQRIDALDPDCVTFLIRSLLNIADHMVSRISEDFTLVKYIDAEKGRSSPVETLEGNREESDAKILALR
jgi:hypothetical protein